MKKTYIKRLSLFLGILMIIASLPAGTVSAVAESLSVAQVAAQTVDNYEGTDFSYKHTGDLSTVTITDYEGSDTDLVIPTKIWGYTVTSISASAFNGCNKLTSVTIPEGVTSIGNYAFANCTALQSIAIPPSVTFIGVAAFQSCTNLKNVYISDTAAWCNVNFYGGNSNPLYYATKLYINNSLVTSVSVPSGVTSIPGYAFSCENITSVTIPASVTGIECNAFAHCTNLKNITIPTSVTSIGGYAFYACDDLRNITVPASVESIGDTAFANCYRLEAIYVNSLNENYTSVNGVLYTKDMTELICYPVNKADTVFEIPEGVETIGEYAFFNNRKLESVIISDGVTKISEHAFDHAYSLTSVTIPPSLSHVRDYVFYDCIYLENVYISDISAWCGITFGSNQSNPLTRAKNLYINNELVGDVVIPDGVESIADYAFCGTSLTSVTIPESVKNIGKSAFSSCSGLTSVEIPSAITTIPANAFCNSGIKSVVIPTGVTKIDTNAFYGCELDEVVYGSTAEAWGSINIESGNDALTGVVCYETKFIATENGIKYRISADDEGEILGYTGEGTEVIIPDEIKGYPVKRIVSEAFNGCESLTSVVISEGIEGIGDTAFANCTSLTSITIPDSVTSIGTAAFRNCTSLASISIPDSIKSIGALAFAGTAYYTDSANWIDGVLYIDNALIRADTSIEGTYEINSDTVIVADEAFKRVGLEGIVIPTSIANIGNDAFYNCESLKNVYISDISVWCNIEFGNTNSYPLYYADNLYVNNQPITDLVIPDGVTYIPAYAFACDSITSVTIPRSVTEIESYAFKGCKGITELTTGFVGDYMCRDAFSGCGKLSTVTITEGVENIGKGAFNYCINLTSVTIPESVTSIGDNAFSGCSSLTSINIPKGVEYLGRYVFANCTGLTWIEIPEGVTRIEDEAFSGCKNLVCVIIPKNVSEIAWGAFGYCDNLWHVLYGGTQEQWASVSIEYGNDCLKNTVSHCDVTSDVLTDISKEAACIEQGYEGVHCTVCDDEIHVVFMDAKGHSYNNGTCTVCGSFPESMHPYTDGCNENWMIYEDDAESISITFSEDTYTQWNRDYIYIYDSEGYVVGVYAGDTLAGKMVTVEGDTVRICLTSDSSDNYYGFKIVAVEIKEKPKLVYTDEKTNISLEYTEGEVDSEAELVVQEITDDKHIEDIDHILLGEKVVKLYDITLQKGSVEIQPRGEVEVKIPVKNKNAKIYRVEEDNTVTDMNAVFEDGYLVFTTEHFSLYAVVQETPAYEMGDVNLDGVVNIKDATTVQKWVASIIELSDEALAVADMNNDGNINVKDATAIQKFIAGL